MKKIPDNFYRTSIKALILDNKKRFLLSLEENGYWEFPGGGLDFGENSLDCLKRELKEEMDLKSTHIDEQPSYFVTALHLNGLWKANVFYNTTVKNLKFKPSDECVELRFFTVEEAKKENLYPIVKEFIKIYNPEKHEPGEAKL
jgi:8-oxo-dGTP diphosphatase